MATEEQIVMTDNMNIADNLSQLIGNTPLVRINKMAQDIDATIVGNAHDLNRDGC